MTMRADFLLFFGLSLALGACATPYWTRPGATETDLVEASDACYREAVSDEVPVELASGRPSPGGPGVLPATVAPPSLWKRAPSKAGFTQWDEQVQYEACMRRGGWHATRPSTGR